ncbi:MAG: hypothetical protein ACYCX4_17560 [Bacillota bacterium]
MRKNIYLQGDSLMIAFVLTVFLGIGLNIFYSIYAYQAGTPWGMWFSAASVLFALLLVSGIVNYNKLAFYLYLIFSLATIAFGVYQLFFLGVNQPLIQEAGGYVNILIGLVYSILLFGGRHRYLVKYSRSRIYY